MGKPKAPARPALGFTFERTTRADVDVCRKNEPARDSVAHFSKGPLQAYQEEYEFGDCGATLTEARLGSTGFWLREQYFSPVS